MYFKIIILQIQSTPLKKNDKKSKLLIFSNDLKKGGIEKVIINSLIYFNTYKYKTDILLLKNNIQFVNSDLKKYNINYIIDNKKNLLF